MATTKAQITNETTGRIDKYACVIDALMDMNSVILNQSPEDPTMSTFVFMGFDDEEDCAHFNRYDETLEL